MDLVATERVERRRALAYSTHACTMDITERIDDIITDTRERVSVMKAEAVSRSGERRRWPIGLRRALTCLSAIPGWFRPASTRPTSRPSAGLKQIGSGWAVSCAIPNTR